MAENLQVLLDQLRKSGFYYFDILANDRDNFYSVYASKLRGGRGEYIEYLYDCDNKTAVVTNHGK
jgi:DNA modification methylase